MLSNVDTHAHPSTGFDSGKHQNYLRMNTASKMFWRVSVSMLCLSLLIAAEAMGNPELEESLVSPINSMEVAVVADSTCCADGPVGSKLKRSMLKILSLNLGHGRKDAANQLLVRRENIYRNLDDVVARLTDTAPDVIALQEADAPSGWSGGFDHVEYIVDQADYPSYIHGVHAESWLYSFGTALLSRATFANSDSHRFTPSFPTTTKGLVAATLNWPNGGDNQLVTLVSVHLDFSRKKVRQAQIDELVALAELIETPLIIAGDMNGEWTKEGSAVRILAERLKLTLYMPEAEGLGTYKSIAGKRLDWILISKELEFVSYSVLPDVLSDHLAVVAEIAYRQ
jgi:endonuclease/exonuclease/phosphatase family metal-dependent hydrolase